MDRRIAWIGALWGILIIGFLAYAAWPALVGTTIELQLAPVDPIDILRGDYMTLSYAIATIDDDVADWPFAAGDTIYISVHDDDNDGIWTARGYWHTRPGDGVFLKGTVAQGASRALLGIERYYIPEGSGDGVRVDDSYSARIKVDEQGNARVLELRKDGERVDFTYAKGD